LGEPSWRSGNRFYLDTNLFIYAIEDISPFAEQIRPLLQAADRGEIQLVTSLLALAETLVMPFRTQDDWLIAKYRRLFTQPPTGLLVSPLDAGILERAAGLRARTPSLRLPDAIHIATAEAEQCDYFLTNDKGLRNTVSLAVVVLAEGK
jgi:predicted nucleic acid-binding protein